MYTLPDFVIKVGLTSENNLLPSMNTASSPSDLSETFI
jgi:hypothetical protein